jgi:predicted ATPase
MTSVNTISIPKSKLALNNLHLYGRETEISSLNEAHKRSFKSCQVVWLYGYGGVGKSTLVQHVFQGKENYCYGKFDRVGLAQPYSALVNIVSRICYILEFDYPPINVSPDDASILSRVVPEVSQVLDFEVNHKQVHQDSFEKLKQALRAFVKGACEVICSSSSPLILCLDDLQWADVDSVEIIKALLTDSEIEGLLFIGSYRDNEVDDSSPIMHCMKAIGETTDNVTEIQVTNLTEGSIDCLVADLTQMPLSVSEPLGKLIYGKTLGNAFFAIHMLQHICETNLLEYSTCTRKWEWKAENIHLEVDISDNVVDFLTQKLRALPVSTKEALEIAASLGSRIDIKLLESIPPAFNFDLNRYPLKEILEVAVEAHLIDMNSSKTCFKFSHDRIQTAAYELTPPGILRQKNHLQIGQQLQCMETDDQSGVRQWQLVLAVDQLNRGSALIENEQGQVELARLNLLAAKEVITTSAFKMAEGFLETGIELLGLRRWIKQYELTLQLSNTLVSVLFSNGSMDNCLILIKQIYGRARCGEDRYKAQFIHVELLHCSSRLSECMDAGLSILRDLGHPKVPKKTGLIHIILAILGVKKLLRNMSDADLLNLPVCEDKRMLSIIRHRTFFKALARSGQYV